MDKTENKNLETKLNELKGNIKSLWGEITDDELKRAEGNIQSVSSLVQQKLDSGADLSKEKLNSLKDRLKSYADSAGNEASSAIQSTLKSINDKLETSKSNLKSQ